MLFNNTVYIQTPKERLPQSQLDLSSSSHHSTSCFFCPVSFMCLCVLFSIIFHLCPLVHLSFIPHFCSFSPFPSIGVSFSLGLFRHKKNQNPFPSVPLTLSLCLSMRFHLSLSLYPSLFLLLDFVIFFEFKHWKPQKKKLSTRCYAIMEADECQPNELVCLELYDDDDDVMMEEEVLGRTAVNCSVDFGSFPAFSLSSRFRVMFHFLLVFSCPLFLFSLL